MEQLNKILKKSNGSYINVNNGNIVNNVNNVIAIIILQTYLKMKFIKSIFK